MIDSILKGLLATTPLEAVSVVFGLLYSILAVKRVRWCWVFGGLGSGLLVYLTWVAKLPMQAALQGYYVAMAVYGFWRWSRHQGEAVHVVSTLPLKAHLAAWAVILALSAGSSHILTGQTQAAWPFLDSLTTWGSLFATWLTAQVKLENWVYWIVFDAISVYLFVAQGLMFVALLFTVYLGVATVGFFSWHKTWRAHAQPA